MSIISWFGASSRDLKPHLGIVSARKINVTQTKKAIVIFVPKLQHQRWQKLQDKLVRELEKKFSDEHVLFIAQRPSLGTSDELDIGFNNNTSNIRQPYVKERGKHLQIFK